MLAYVTTFPIWTKVMSHSKLIWHYSKTSSGIGWKLAKNHWLVLNAFSRAVWIWGSDDLVVSAHFLFVYKQFNIKMFLSNFWKSLFWSFFLCISHPSQVRILSLGMWTQVQITPKVCFLNTVTDHGTDTAVPTSGTKAIYFECPKKNKLLKNPFDCQKPSSFSDMLLMKGWHFGDTRFYRMVLIFTYSLFLVVSKLLKICGLFFTLLCVITQRILQINASHPNSQFLLKHYQSSHKHPFPSTISILYNWWELGYRVFYWSRLACNFNQGFSGTNQ